MKLLAGLAIWLLVSLALGEDNAFDNLIMFENMDSTLGMFEKNFGESVTKKLSFALFEGTQNMRPPMEIASKFMQELTPEEIASISKGVISMIQEIAELLKQPEAQDQLTSFINAAPLLFATLSSLSGGEFGNTGADTKDAVSAGKWSAGDSDPFESMKHRNKWKPISDYEPLEIQENIGEDVMELAGDLLKTGASLLGTFSSSLSGGSKYPGGGLMGLASKFVARMIEEGALEDEFLKNFDPDADLWNDDDSQIETDEEDLIEAEKQPEVKKQKTSTVKSQSTPAKPESKSTKDQEKNEIDHLEL